MSGAGAASSAERRLEIFANAMDIIGSALSEERAGRNYSSAASSRGPETPSPSGPRPLLYGPDGSAIRPDASYRFRRTAARRSGSMKTWIPRRVLSDQSEALEREQITARAVDLANSDPIGAGVVDTFAATVIGSGLTPHPMLDREALGLDEDAARSLTASQRAVFRAWYPFADASGRMSYGAIQYLKMRSLVEYGEYLVLLPMLSDPSRPYSLACQVVSPLRLKTPVDLVASGTVRDGIELGPYGEPVAYWIKKSSPDARLSALPDVSANFARLPAKTGHRWNVIHRFVPREPEQLRGVSFFGPGMKMFRDSGDYLDSELVANIVTAALALWIETGASKDPFQVADNLKSFTETGYQRDGAEKAVRYQEMVPGTVMYGNRGEIPHLLSPNRPGQTFEPFMRKIHKTIAMSVNYPYAILFSDMDGMSFAGYRGAMLDAWRSVMFYRQLTAEGSDQAIYTMLMEEAYLRGEFSVPDFYLKMHALTRCQWRGAPKGDIEPVKAVQADQLAIETKIKTREEAIAERGDADCATVFDQLAEEEKMLRERNLLALPVAPGSPAAAGDGEENGAQALDGSEALNGGTDA